MKLTAVRITSPCLLTKIISFVRVSQDCFQLPRGPGEAHIASLIQMPTQWLEESKQDAFSLMLQCPQQKVGPVFAQRQLPVFSSHESAPLSRPALHIIYSAHQLIAEAGTWQRNRDSEKRQMHEATALLLLPSAESDFLMDSIRTFLGNLSESQFYGQHLVDKIVLGN